ncbi:FAD-dependent oxidoreductase [Tessaracoccus rhinocerotis]|uniref:FAD-dependent oxidoreductase n=1 Tax=Tessaracoccus rhinocerotis TaxID=1689449 RepID=A0A553K0K4_9ACTN|nr:FAD-dependent oxidoreductase [Tessaracoccus rhinocerotis]TRY18233.1 FAD-dependent oxidoreductase [Tessaracoccus rhinocerotis]
MGLEDLDADVVVAGGGMAGICAAIAAARQGLDVVLVQNRPVLGGNSSSEVRVWVCGATATGHQRYARETGIVGELYLQNEFVNPLGNPAYWDLVLLEAVNAEPRIRLFLNTHIHDVHVSGSTVDAISAHVLGSERDLCIRADYFIDCTGDGFVAARAGAEFMLGREARGEFDEGWAPEVADDTTLGSTILFYTKEESEPVPFVAPSFAIDVAQTSILESRILRTGDNGAAYWWIEWGGELDVVGDNERIRDELWAVIYGIWDYIKNSGNFDADTLTLEWVGSIPGKREYRRILGSYVMTQSDVEVNRRKSDAIGFGGWSIDLHPSKGVYEPKGAAQQIYPPGIYDIPFGILHARGVDNLLMAGRNVSASHVAFGSLRVMATCGVMGEAAGTAAAVCRDRGLLPAELAADVRPLQERLLRADAALAGLALHDPTDLAPYAKVAASSTLDTTVGPDPVDWVRLESDTAVLFPQTAVTTWVRAALRADSPTTVRWSVRTTPDALAFTPAETISEGEAAVGVGGVQLVEVPLPPGDGERNLALVLHAQPDVSWGVAGEYRFGQLSMKLKGDGGVAEEIDLHLEASAPNDVVRWDIKSLNRTTLAIAHPGSAYTPERAASSHLRPHDGPQAWVSAPMADEPEWLELRWDNPVDVDTLSLVFNDDVNQYANNLHYKRWPFRVVPELVADYDVEVLRDGTWQRVERKEGNRRRHRVHQIRSRNITATRVLISRTNGAASAHVVAIRAYGKES